jgi:FOG: Ankyrin repeat
METEKKEIWQIANEIEYAYRDKKSEEEILAMYAAIEDKHATDSANRDRTYLHFAAKHADAKAIEYLIEQGVQPNIKTRYGGTLLHILAEEADSTKYSSEKIKETVNVILKARVSPLMRDEDSRNLCYHMAAERGNLPFIHAMIDNKVKLDMTDRDGKDILYLLVCRPARYAQEGLKYTNKKEEEIAKLKNTLEECFELIKALIEYGLDPESTVKYAVEHNLDKIAILLKGEYDESDSSLTDKIAAKGKTLHQAAEKDFDALEALIRLGADVNEVCTEDREYKNMTPLGVACKYSNLDGIKALLAAGADPNIHDGEKEKSAMYYLVEYCVGGKNDKEKHEFGRLALKTLLDAGLDINGFVDSEMNTALNLSCHSRYSWDMASFYRVQLLESGLCDLNLVDKNGVTPLMNLCRNADMENDVILMLEQGVDMSLRDTNGDTALMYLARNGNQGIACSVADLMFSFGDPLPAVANNESKTALDIAIEENNEDLVKFLLGKM